MRRRPASDLMPVVGAASGVQETQRSTCAAALQSLLDGDLDPTQRAALERGQALLAATWSETVGGSLEEDHTSAF